MTDYTTKKLSIKKIIEKNLNKKELLFIARKNFSSKNPQYLDFIKYKNLYIVKEDDNKDNYYEIWTLSGNQLDIKILKKYLFCFLRPLNASNDLWEEYKVFLKQEKQIIKRPKLFKTKTL